MEALGERSFPPSGFATLTKASLGLWGARKRVRARWRGPIGRLLGSCTLVLCLPGGRRLEAAGPTSCRFQGKLWSPPTCTQGPLHGGRGFLALGRSSAPRWTVSRLAKGMPVLKALRHPATPQEPTRLAHQEAGRRGVYALDRLVPLTVGFEGHNDIEPSLKAPKHALKTARKHSGHLRAQSSGFSHSWYSVLLEA